MDALPPLTAYHLFGRRLAHAARRWRLVMNERLLPFGLTEATWLPLIYIAREDKPLRQKDLAEMLGIEGSSLVRLIDALAAAGLVERRIENDRRARMLVLTDQGRRLVKQVETVSAEVRDQALTGIAAEELTTSLSVIERVCVALDSGKTPETGEDPNE